jgi:hypothetical protein
MIALVLSALLLAALSLLPDRTPASGSKDKAAN